MDKIWVKDVKEGDRPKSVFLVARKATPTAKSGKAYLSVTFQDKTGELEARAFEKVEETGALFEEKDLVEVEGIVGTFQGKPQLKIESIAKVDPAAHDAAEFVWVPAPEPKKPEKPAASEAQDALWAELLGLVAAISDKHVRDLVMAFVEDDDVAHRLRRSAAAKSVHHAYSGGLLEHTVSCLKLAHRLADQYPQVDRDLLVAGAFFHDLGKIRELQGEKGVEYSDEGKLVGHLVMAAQWIHDKARRIGVPRDLEHHIVHLVLAHHGRLEFGSPKVPMTLEALLTHYIDELDSRVNSWLNLMGREGGARRWTSSDNVYEQPIWRGALPTAQVEKKGPAPELLTPVIYVPRGAGGGGGGGARGRSARRSRRTGAGPSRVRSRPRPARRSRPRARSRRSPRAPPRAPRTGRRDRARPERTERPRPRPRRRPARGRPRVRRRLRRQEARATRVPGSPATAARTARPRRRTRRSRTTRSPRSPRSSAVRPRRPAAEGKPEHHEPAAAPPEPPASAEAASPPPEPTEQSSAAPMDAAAPDAKPAE